jgi:hypothetical protein
MSEYKVVLDEREQKVLTAAAEQKDMPPEAVIRHWFRIGQLVDYLQTEGTATQQLFVRRLFDSLVTEPKKAPTDFVKLTHAMQDALASVTSPTIAGFKNLLDPDASIEVRETTLTLPTQLSCGCEVGCCICDYEKD